MPFVQKKKTTTKNNNNNKNKQQTLQSTCTVGVQIGKNNKFVRMQLDQLT